jgi:hypothetical protein
MISHRGIFTPYLPSPDQIREGCRQIRREWSMQERATRRAGGRYAWRLLILRHPDFDRHRPIRSF